MTIFLGIFGPLLEILDRKKGPKKYWGVNCREHHEKLLTISVFCEFIPQYWTHIGKTPNRLFSNIGLEKYRGVNCWEHHEISQLWWRSMMVLPVYSPALDMKNCGSKLLWASWTIHWTFFFSWAPTVQFSFKKKNAKCLL